MAIEREVRGNFGNRARAKRNVRHKMPVHNVHVDHGNMFFHGRNFFIEPAEIRGKDGWGDFDFHKMIINPYRRLSYHGYNE